MSSLSTFTPFTEPQSAPTRKRLGIFRRARTFLFGERDAIADELSELQRQGAAMARAAHLVSFLLLVAFSLASVVALTGDALTAVQASWTRGTANLTASIAILVSVLLVVGVDFAALWAANRLRIMANRQTHAKSQWVDISIIVLSVVFEASTYVLMSALYDTIPTRLVWGIILGRGITGPLIAIYLQMARPLPVSARDILYKTELASGKAVITHAVRIASDPDVGLGESARIYRASAQAAPADRARLDELVDALGEPQRMGLVIEAEGDLPPPTGPGTPLVARGYTGGVKGGEGMGERALVRLTPNSGGRRARVASPDGSGSRTAAAATAVAARPTARPVGQPKPTSSNSVRRYEREAREAWKNGAQSIPTMKTATGMAHGTAAYWVGKLSGEERGYQQGRREQAPVAQ